MNRKASIAILVTFFIGVLIQIYIGDFKNELDLANQIASVVGGGIGFLIAVIALPSVVSLIMMVKMKKFPKDTFTTMTYILLVIFALIMFIGQWHIKSMANAQFDEIENLRNKIKEECVSGTSMVYEFIETSNKEEIKRRSREYCDCLYGKITRQDLNRLLEQKLLVPELLNIEYKEQKDICFQENFKGIDVIYMEDLMETEDDKKAFWSSKLVSYYLMTYGEFKSEFFIKALNCFTPTFERDFSKMISDWEMKELTATEIFVDEPIIKIKIEECYNEVKYLSQSQ